MTAGITSLPIRSSPTRRNLLQRAVQLAYSHNSTAKSQSTSATADTMLARANKEYVQPPREPLAKQLFPSSSPGANNDIRDQFKKPGSTHAASSARTGNNDQLAQVHNPSTLRRGTGNGSLASLYAKSDSFKHEPSGLIDLTGPDAQERIKQEVFFAEDDFSDDENLDLEFEAPSALPAMPKSDVTVKENMPPPPAPTQEIEWSSSPPSHWLPPKTQRTISGASDTTMSSLKRQSSDENDSFEAPAPKKRVLPWTKKTSPADEMDQAAVTKTPAKSSKKGYWDPTASAIKEQKRQLKNQRQPTKTEVEDEPMESDSRQAQETVTPKAAPFSLSKEQKHVLKLVVENNQSVFFTGAAGTGKSVLMRAIISELKKKYARDPERVAVTASTGLAACNIGGITLHSFSGKTLWAQAKTGLI